VCGGVLKGEGNGVGGVFIGGEERYPNRPWPMATRAVTTCGRRGGGVGDEASSEASEALVREDEVVAW
jgi:hypothetical protein